MQESGGNTVGPGLHEDAPGSTVQPVGNYFGDRSGIDGAACATLFAIDRNFELLTGRQPNRAARRRCREARDLKLYSPSAGKLKVSEIPPRVPKGAPGTCRSCEAVRAL